MVRVSLSWIASSARCEAGVSGEGVRVVEGGGPYCCLGAG